MTRTINGVHCILNEKGEVLYGVQKIGNDLQTVFAYKWSHKNRNWTIQRPINPNTLRSGLNRGTHRLI